MFQKKLFPGIELEEETVEKLLSPYYPELWRVIREPFDDFCSRRSNDPAFAWLDEGESAQWMHSQIIRATFRVFDDHPFIKPIRRNQQFYLNCGGQFAVIFKKLKRRRSSVITVGGPGLTFSSYPTPQNLALWSQRVGYGVPDMPRFLVGYLFREQMSAVDVWLAYPRGKTAGIYLLVPNQDGIVAGTHVPEFDVDEYDEEKGFIIKPRKQTKEKPGNG